MKKLFLVCVCAALTGCGGGSGSGVAGGTGPYFADSYGVNYHSGGFSAGDSGMDGGAGDGAPIVGGLVTITDSAGHSVSATTDSNGIYHAKINDFVPPFLVQVLKPNAGGVRYSLGTDAPVVNGFIVVNLSSITSKIVSDVAVAAGLSDASQIDVQFLGNNSPASLSTSIDIATTALQNQLYAVIVAAGLSPASFDPIGFAFIPNHTGYDFVLDNVSLSTPTQLDIVPTFAGTPDCPFIGTYTGTLAGGDAGTFTAVVDPSCTVALLGTTTAAGSFSGTAFLSNNSLSLTASGQTTTGAQFTGTLVNQTLSGTWANSAAGLRGTFSASYVPPQLQLSQLL